MTPPPPQQQGVSLFLPEHLPGGELSRAAPAATAPSTSILRRRTRISVPAPASRPCLQPAPSASILRTRTRITLPACARPTASQPASFCPRPSTSQPTGAGPLPCGPAPASLLDEAFPLDALEPGEASSTTGTACGLRRHRSSSGDRSTLAQHRLPPSLPAARHVRRPARLPPLRCCGMVSGAGSGGGGSGKDSGNAAGVASGPIGTDAPVQVAITPLSDAVPSFGGGEVGCDCVGSVTGRPPAAATYADVTPPTASALPRDVGHPSSTIPAAVEAVGAAPVCSDLLCTLLKVRPGAVTRSYHLAQATPDDEKGNAAGTWTEMSNGKHEDSVPPPYSQPIVAGYALATRAPSGAAPTPNEAECVALRGRTDATDALCIAPDAERRGDTSPRKTSAGATPSTMQDPVGTVPAAASPAAAKPTLSTALVGVEGGAETGRANPGEPSTATARPAQRAPSPPRIASPVPSSSETIEAASLSCASPGSIDSPMPVSVVPTNATPSYLKRVPCADALDGSSSNRSPSAPRLNLRPALTTVPTTTPRAVCSNASDTCASSLFATPVLPRTVDCTALLRLARAYVSATVAQLDRATFSLAAPCTTGVKPSPDGKPPGATRVPLTTLGAVTMGGAFAGTLTGVSVRCAVRFRRLLSCLWEDTPVRLFFRPTNARAFI